MAKLVPTIGILGSGQLGRMIALSAASLGMRAHIYAPDAKGSPAGDVAAEVTTAAYDDETALEDFAKSIDGVTSEFENVPSATLAILARHLPLVSPSIKALDTAQDRLSEKHMARALGIATPRFWQIDTLDDIAKALDELGGKGVLKTRRDGYDGKGQLRVTTGDNPARIFDEIGGKPLILESFVDFTQEASFLIARDASGAICHFPASLNHHRDGILAHSTAPAPIDEAIVQKGQAAIASIATELELFGILAMETFITHQGDIIFNEIAPRPHNSYHWSIEGAHCSQFEQLARLVGDLPMRTPAITGGKGTLWRMENLLGQHASQIASLQAQDDVSTHLYGKSAYRDGRKIGHITYAISADQLSDNDDKSYKVD